MRAWWDAGRLAVGTLTVLPTRPPGRLDRIVAGRAMALAPLVGLLLAVPLLVALRLLGVDGGPLGTGPPGGGPPPLLVAALAVGALALLTRGMHLDGLADAADGLGSGKPAEGALAVMRRSDIGPFGVLTLVLVLLVQVAALGHLLARGSGAPALLLALVVSRLALPLACSRGIPAARAEGLGHLVAGTVSRGGLVVAVALAGVALAVGVGLAAALGLSAPGRLVAVGGNGAADLVVGFVVGLLVAALLPLLVTGFYLRRCVRRFGGVTGDVLGACVEVAFTGSLVAAALLL